MVDDEKKRRGSGGGCWLDVGDGSKVGIDDKSMMVRSFYGKPGMLGMLEDSNL